MLTYWILIPFIAFCSNLALVMYALHMGVRHPVNRIFAVVLGALAWWALCSSVYPLVLDVDSYNLAACIGAPAWIFIGPLLLHFVLVVVRDRPLLPDYPLYALVYLPGVPLLLLRWFTPLIFTVDPTPEVWGFQQVPGRLLFLYVGYLQIFQLVTLGILIRAIVRRGPGVVRRRFICVLVGSSIPVIGGTITNLILPLLGITVYWSAVGLTSAGAALFALGIFRYRMLSPTLRSLSGQVFRNMSQPVILADPEGVVLEANAAARALAEYSSQDLIGLQVAEIFSRGQADWDSLLARRDAEGQVVNAEVSWFGSNGEGVPVLVSLTTLRGHDHLVQGYLLLAVDYRELKQAELALRESETLYRTLYEGSVLGVVLIKDTVRQINRQAAAIMGVTPAEVIGCTPERFWAETQPDGRPSAEVGPEIIRAAARTPQFYLWRCRRADGTLVDCEMSMHAVTVQGERMLQITMRDVTDQRWLEEAVQQLHHATANVVGTALFGAVAEHLALWLGVSWAQVGEIRPEDPDTVHVLAIWRDAELAAPYSYALAGAPCEKVVAAGFQYVASGLAAQYPGNANLTDQRIEGYVGLPLEDMAGRVIGVVCVFHEEPLQAPPPLVEAVFKLVAARVSAELLRLRAEMHEREHAEHLRELQRMESVALLAGGVAHDFNNILVGVLGHASLARETIPPENPALRSLAVIEESAERAVGLTTQLLAYARGGKQNPVPLDLRAAVADLLEMLSAVLPKGVKVQCLLPDGLPAVLADPSQMQQVVLNLCTNAGEAMADMGGTLTVRLALMEGAPHCPAPGEEVAALGQLVLTIADTGCGMDVETASHIFEPFFSTKGFGRGLGLAAAQGIVVNHGGCLHCDTQPGRGTTFRLYLPALDAPADTHDRATGGGLVGAAGTETILVADDEFVVREFTSDVLTSLGYHVIPVESGDEALAQYREHAEEIDLVVLDVVMPGRNGLETLGALRELDPAVKVVLTSGYAEDQLPGGQHPTDATPFLKKPYRPGTLAEVVRTALAN